MKPLALLAVLAAILSISCATSTTAPAAQAKPEPKPVIVGETTQEQIEESLPDWAVAEAESQPDPETCKALASVPS
ncbi:MAG TPA: hypothetical protein VF179_15935, partial [Thermoanaerobaculia bacterium]|nr:hypothetical protein [Thermoanaerobaculia bacterium]